MVSSCNYAALGNGISGSRRTPRLTSEFQLLLNLNLPHLLLKMQGVSESKKTSLLLLTGRHLLCTSGNVTACGNVPHALHSKAN